MEEEPSPSLQRTYGTNSQIMLSLPRVMLSSKKDLRLLCLKKRFIYSTVLPFPLAASSGYGKWFTSRYPSESTNCSEYQEKSVRNILVKCHPVRSPKTTTPCGSTLRPEWWPRGNKEKNELPLLLRAPSSHKPGLSY